MSLARLIADTDRHLRDYYSGRIDPIGGCWEYAGNIPDAVQVAIDDGKTGIILGEGKTREIWKMPTDGRVRVCRPGRGVTCPNVQKYPEAFSNGRMCWVRQSTCKKCEYYRSTKDSPEKYPVCQWARDHRLAGRTVSRAVSDSILGSLDKAAAVYDGGAK
jgi:hypothetical protein